MTPEIRKDIEKILDRIDELKKNPPKETITYAEFLERRDNRKPKGRRMSVEFNTRVYEFEHGRTPRGLGSWAFSYVRNPRMDQIFWVHGTYAEAKKIAREKAKTEKQTEVYVCP